jgi:hypothetical protein
MTPRSLRLTVLLFWALWLTVVTASNVTNALRVAGALPTSFAFASANFELIEASTAVYHAPRGVVWVLLLGVIAWEALAAGLFWRAALTAWRQRPGAADSNAWTPLAPAFATALGLFAAFMLADELLIAYPLQATHMRVFIALGVSWLVVRPPGAS